MSILFNPFTGTFDFTGSQTPWLQDIDADGYDLSDLGTLSWRGLSNSIAGIFTWDDSTGAFGAPKNTGTLSASGGNFASFVTGVITAELAAFFNIFQAVGGSALAAGAPIAAAVYESTNAAFNIGGLLVLGFNNGANPDNDVALGSIYYSAYMDGNAQVNGVWDMRTTEDWDSSNQGLMQSFYYTPNGTTGLIRALSMGSGYAVVVNPDTLSNGHFRVVSLGDQNLIRTDAANDRVGIGTASPAYKFDVNGDVRATGYRSSDASSGISTTITTGSLVGKTITVKNGLITSFA